MAPNTKKGGARPGSGRPRNITKALAKADRAHAELAVQMKQGYNAIAESMPEIVEAAIKLALGFTGTTRDGKPRIVPPDVKMIKVLLDIGMGALEAESESFDKLTTSTPADILQEAIKDAQSGKTEVTLREVVVRQADPLSLFASSGEGGSGQAGGRPN